MQPEEEEEEELLMTKSASGRTHPIRDDLHMRLNGSRASGQPLPDVDRSFMERRFGSDFSGVKVHTDSNAVQMSKELNAEAFTYGRDIYFGAGRYSSGTSSGKRLLAHELTHVVQQGKGKPNIVRSNEKLPTVKPTLAHRPIVNRMKIAQVGTPPKLDCGAYRYDWKLELSNPAPCDGFMVQHVKVRETKKDCSKPPVSSIAVKPIAQFWESWRFKKNDTLDVDFSKYGYSDRFSEGPKPSSTGTHADTGKVKFFCKPTTGDLDKLWSPNKYSGGLPATSSEPSWWKNKTIDTGFHWASSWWNCCGERKKWWNKTDAKP